MKISKFIQIITVGLIILSFSLLTFAQTDVTRKTVAVTYPLNQEIYVTFRGTTRFPRLIGQAKVKRQNKTGTRVTLTLENVPRPYELGEAYTTFVLWAISPEGNADNLGEIKRRSNTWFFDTKIEVTTPFQTFALIVTAEPHFLVKEPSRAVILENLAPAGVATSLNIQYFGNSSDYFRDAKVPEIAEADYVRTPVALLGARQAVNLAKFASANREAEVEFEYAEKSLQQAEAAWKSNRPENEVDTLARQATAAGVRAEEVAGVRKQARLRREEKLKQDAEVEKAESKTEDAVRQISELKTELASEQRTRELAERDNENYTKQIADLRAELQQVRGELTQARQDAEDARVKLARIEGEKQVVAKQQEEQEKQRTAEANQRAYEEKMARLQANIPYIMQNLKPFGTTKQTSRGATLVLPETYWSGTRVSSFSATSNAKIDRLAAVMMNYPDYKIVIESHTDDKGTADDLITLTQERAQAIADKLMTLGVPQDRIEVKGFGASLPVAANTTNVNRAKNRRTEITLVPNAQPETAPAQTQTSQQ